MLLLTCDVNPVHTKVFVHEVSSVACSELPMPRCCPLRPLFRPARSLSSKAFAYSRVPVCSHTCAGARSCLQSCRSVHRFEKPILSVTCLAVGRWQTPACRHCTACGLVCCSSSLCRPPPIVNRALASSFAHISKSAKFTCKFQTLNLHFRLLYRFKAMCHLQVMIIIQRICHPLYLQLNTLHFTCTHASNLTNSSSQVS